MPTARRRKNRGKTLVVEGGGGTRPAVPAHECQKRNTRQKITRRHGLHHRWRPAGRAEHAADQVRGAHGQRLGLTPHVRVTVPQVLVRQVRRVHQGVEQQPPAQGAGGRLDAGRRGRLLVRVHQPRVLVHPLDRRQQLVQRAAVRRHRVPERHGRRCRRGRWRRFEPRVSLFRSHRAEWYTNTVAAMAAATIIVTYGFKKKKNFDVRRKRPETREKKIYRPAPFAYYDCRVVVDGRPFSITAYLSVTLRARRVL